MIRNIFICLLTAVLIFSACDKKCISTTIPQCIAASIETNKDNADWAIKTIEEYTFQGKTVYVYKPVTEAADMTTTIYSDDCNRLCDLGGLIGNTDCGGVNFFQNATFKKVIWQK